MSSTDRSVRMRPRTTRKRSRPCLFRSLRLPTNAMHSPSIYMFIGVYAQEMQGGLVQQLL